MGRVRRTWPASIQCWAGRKLGRAPGDCVPSPRPEEGDLDGDLAGEPAAAAAGGLPAPAGELLSFFSVPVIMKATSALGIEGGSDKKGDLNDRRPGRKRYEWQ